MKKIDARKLSTEIQQHNRDTAIRLFQEGRSRKDIAAIVGVHYMTVCKWIDAFKKAGKKGIIIGKRGRIEGTKRKLTAEQEAVLRKKLIDHAPQQMKLDFALWTSRAIRTLIWDLWRVHIAARTIRTYMRRWGFTPQKPLLRAYERDPKKVQRWLNEDYPAIKAHAKAQGAAIFWVDETGVCNEPQHGRGYAPVGKTPVLEHSSKRYRVNMISALDNRGKVRFMLYKETMTAKVLLRFVKRLITDAKRKVFVILDNLRVHHAKIVRDWVSKHSHEIELQYLPAYSPDLNPDEYLNGDLKARMRNAKPARNEAELLSTVRSHMKILQENPERVMRYFHHPKIQYAA